MQFVALLFGQMPHYFYPVTLGFAFNPQLNTKCDQFIELENFWTMVDGKYSMAWTLVVAAISVGQLDKIIHSQWSSIKTPKPHLINCMSSKMLCAFVAGKMLQRSNFSWPVDKVLNRSQRAGSGRLQLETRLAVLDAQREPVTSAGVENT